MDLTLKRKWFTPHSTVGELYVDGAFECFTLEDPVRTGPKIPGKTAIPYGIYKVILNLSNRFKKRMPLLLSVPGFAGVRIHSGNTAEDTEGCILVGAYRSWDRIGDSRKAFSALMEKLEGAESITLTIEKET